MTMRKMDSQPVVKRDNEIVATDFPETAPIHTSVKSSGTNALEAQLAAGNQSVKSLISTTGATPYKPKVGRPKKDAPTPRNNSDASQKRIEKYTREILKLFLLGSIFHKHFCKVDQEKRTNLGTDLAHELAFFPAMQGLISDVKSKRRGPKQKKAQALFLTQVRQVLGKYGVQIPLWRNGTGECLELIDFCEALARVTKTPNLRISWRTVKLSPPNGFIG